MAKRTGTAGFFRNVTDGLQTNAGLADPDSDSSIQSYANIYDMNWLTRGNVMIAPGVERVDTVRTDNGYEMKCIWCRDDLSSIEKEIKISVVLGK